MSRGIVGGLLCAMTLASGAHAYDLGEKGKYGKILGDFRYRYEYVDQESLPEDAHANTARLRLGYMTPTYEGFTGYAEMDAVRSLGYEYFNSNTNGHARYPRVNDPDDTRVNQMYLSYMHPTGNGGTVGRQYVTFDTQRFIGWSKFRQNDTTHDAARLSLKPLEGMGLDYVYSKAAYRSLGSKQPLGTYDGDMNMLHADYLLPQDMKIAAYGYWLDFDPYIENLSSRTLGARLEWRPKTPLIGAVTPLATIDLAQQEDMGSNPNHYDETYHWLEIGGLYDGYSLSLVYEKLGGNGKAALQTPIGTVHSFNGWVDKFTTIPADGLEDYFVWFKSPIGLPWEGQTLGFEAQYHHFTSDVNDISYGREVNLGLNYTPVVNHTVTAQVGRYYADTFSDDTTKFWLYYDYKF